jgi:hypothetical protein
MAASRKRLLRNPFRDAGGDFGNVIASENTESSQK